MSDYLIPGNNFNQRCVVHTIDSICRTFTGQGHSGMEPKVLVIKKEKYERDNLHRQLHT